MLRCIQMPPPISLLRRVPLLSELSESDLTSIAALTKSKHFEPRQIIVRKDDPSDELFMIVEGHLKVVSTGADGRDAGFGIMGPGEVFGEVALLDGGPRSATIASLDSCQLLLIPRAQFFEFLESSPKTAIELLRVLAGRLRRLTERAEDVAFLRVGGRLAKRLVGLAQQYGETLPNGSVRIPFKLSQQEIGELVNTSRETANKQLRAWEHAGLLSHDSGHLVIHNPQRLVQQEGDE